MIRQTCVKSFTSDKLVFELAMMQVTPILISFSVFANKVTEKESYKPRFSGRFYLGYDNHTNTSYDSVFLYSSATSDKRNDLSETKLKWFENYFRELFPHMSYGPLKLSL